MTTDSVRHLFPQLFKNGYTPLPNRDKACMMPGWPVVEVDEAKCKRWARQSRWAAIGLRTDQPLLVFDLDLPNADIVAAVRAALPAEVTAGLERIGNAPKTAFFLRMREADEPFREMHTRRYHFPDAPKVTFAVQAFGGGMGAQVGAFGPHSHDDAGRVLRTYQWLGPSPADVPIGQLPEMTRAAVNDALSAADAVLAAWPGLVVDDQAAGTGEGFQPVYDLDEHTVFRDVEGNVYNIEELIAEAKARKRTGQAELRLTGSFLNDPRSTGSPRAKVWWSERNGLAIVDFKTGLTHRPVLNLHTPEMQELLNDIFSKRNAR